MWLFGEEISLYLMSQLSNKLVLNIVFIIAILHCGHLSTIMPQATDTKGFRGCDMLKKLSDSMSMSLTKYANISVSLQVAILSVLNTDFSGQVDVAITSDPIGVQAIEPLFNYFTSIPLLTT